MANKNSNVPYDQTPHIVLNHPETTNDDIAIIRALFKILKDKPQITYSNDQLALDSKVPRRTLQRSLSKLESLGFITITGKSYNRRFALGLLFTTCAKIADKNLHTCAKTEETRAKTASTTRQFGAYTNPSTNPSTKCNLSFSSLTHAEAKEIQHCLEHGFALATEFKYLQPFLDEELKHEKTV